MTLTDIRIRGLAHESIYKAYDRYTKSPEVKIDDSRLGFAAWLIEDSPLLVAILLGAQLADILDSDLLTNL